jgi:hypothetical protein
MENEDYNPQLPNYYNYKAKRHLQLELPDDLNTYENIYICAYQVNNEAKYPFQRFLLINDLFNNVLVFPHIQNSKGLTCNLDIINFAKVNLFTLLYQDNFEIFDENLEFNGYFDNNINSNNDLYLLFDITKCNVQLNDIEKNTNDVWLALLDEILNHKHLCNMIIHPKVSDFFTFNNDLCFLLDENECSYEIPIVGYVGKPESKLNFTYTFGQTMSNKTSLLGPFYYFTNYFHAFDNATIDISDSKPGLVRFALFLGNTKYIQNQLNDAIDDSEIKSLRLEDDTLDQTYERLRMRISDHDGKWSQTYDSAYLGHMELDNGTILNKPTIVLKEYNQQIPLSYHYVNKRTVKNEYAIF